MDSDKLLADIRAEMQAYNDMRKNYDLSTVDRWQAGAFAAREITLAFAELDEWLSRGGTLPVAWTWPTGRCDR